MRRKTKKKTKIVGKKSACTKKKQVKKLRTGLNITFNTLTRTHESPRSSQKDSTFAPRDGNSVCSSARRSVGEICHVNFNFLLWLGKKKTKQKFVLGKYGNDFFHQVFLHVVVFGGFGFLFRRNSIFARFSRYDLH